jgi:transglutaminase-like putative cysteine protease
MLERIAAVLLICVQAATLAYMPRGVVFPSLVAGLAIVGAFARVRIDLNRRMKVYLLVALGIATFVLYLAAPARIPLRSVAVGSHEVYALAHFLVVVQVAQLFLRQPQNRLPGWLPAVGAVCMVGALDVAPLERERDVFLWFSLGFAAAVALYVAAVQRHSTPAGQRIVSLRVLLALAAGLCALALGWTSATSMYRYQRQLDDLFARLVGDTSSFARVGFSGQARLSSVTEFRKTAADQIALRIVSDEEPTYMRGAAFDSLPSTHWESTVSSRLLQPVDAPPAGITDTNRGRSWFTLQPAQSARWQRFEVWRDVSLADTTFAPLGTAVLQASSESATMNEHALVEVLDSSRDPGYAVYVPERPSTSIPSGAYLSSLLKSPPLLDPAVTTLAESLCTEELNTEQKIAAIVEHFHDNYTYHAGITVPPGRDPLAYFLLERPPAHCEYFAAGAAILLRQCGVPCRYVTGFVVHEQNPFSGEWIARNKDAHAWVEAWDDQHGWVTVDATPAEGVPSALDASTERQLWEFVRDHARTLWSRLQRGDLQAAALALVQLLWSPLTLIVGAVAGSVVALRLMIRRRRSQLHATADPQYLELSRLLSRMDRRLRRRKLTRHTGETLHQFATRVCASEPGDQTLAAIADWYRQYAALRYAGQVERPSIQRLRTTLADLQLPRHRA